MPALGWLASDGNGLVVGVIAGVLALSWRLRRSDDILTQLSGWALLLAAVVGVVMQWKDDVWALIPQNIVEAVATGHIERIEGPPALVEEPFFMWFGIALLAAFTLFSIFATIAMLGAAVMWIRGLVADQRAKRTEAATDATGEIVIESTLPQSDQPTLFDDLLLAGSSENSLATPEDIRVKQAVA